MSVSSVSGSNPYAAQSPYLQSKHDMQALQSALGSGNLSSAQADFASFSNDISGFLQNGTSAQTQQPTADMQALQGALNSGDLASAQTDLTTLQQDLKGTGRHHGHHHGMSLPGADSTGTTSTTGNGSSTGAGSLASMLAAYTAGSNSGSASLVNATA